MFIVGDEDKAKPFFAVKGARRSDLFARERFNELNGYLQA